MFNPYQPYINNLQQNNNQIVKVNGENGAKAYPLPIPNSSILLLDENAPRLFLKSTDGAGFPTIEQFKLEKYVPEEQVSIESLIERIDKIERKINTYEKSPTSSTKHKTESESDDTDPKTTKGDVSRKKSTGSAEHNDED